jgi:hypothetical protein
MPVACARRKDPSMASRVLLGCNTEYCRPSNIDSINTSSDDNKFPPRELVYSECKPRHRSDSASAEPQRWRVMATMRGLWPTAGSCSPQPFILYFYPFIPRPFLWLMYVPCDTQWYVVKNDKGDDGKLARDPETTAVSAMAMTKPLF